ncbi:MAG TPA: TIGR03435 family protein [Candidatus Acidoferrales bacterium]|nr:TIGR03435 family protein [Candidatus Acidoferrales bacterium]
MKSVCAIGLGLFAASLAFGQAAATNQSAAAKQPSPKLQFEVASIRPSESSTPDRVNSGLRMDGAQAHLGSQSLKNLIAMAYRVQWNMVSGPDWMASARFDISAKLPEGATTDQIPEMLQSLLADRFGLKVHHETKDGPAYALSLGKSPLKLTESPTDAPSSVPSGSVNVAAAGSAAGVSIDLGHGSSYTFANDQFQFHRFNMNQFVRQLALYMDRPIVNMTDLKGTYDFTLDITQEDYYILLVRSGANAGVNLPPRALQLLGGTPVSLFDALDQQGLHMEARKLLLDTIVVDQVLQTPTEN